MVDRFQVLLILNHYKKYTLFTVFGMAVKSVGWGWVVNVTGIRER
jgi:hypothetical protein